MASYFEDRIYIIVIIEPWILSMRIIRYALAGDYLAPMIITTIPTNEVQKTRFLHHCITQLSQCLI
ncbi:MAG: hypothetical protein M3M87_02195, partial [Thermoproteota archaeon]|nr:hypothetical protein [Thermoproteota archaeon]